MSEKVDFLISMLDLCLMQGDTPSKAVENTVESYARVYVYDDDEEQPEQQGLHRCEPGWDYDTGDNKFPSGCCNGPAVTMCYEDPDGRLWVTNEEYITQVNFCPFCGYEARLKVAGEGSDAR